MLIKQCPAPSMISPHLLIPMPGKITIFHTSLFDTFLLTMDVITIEAEPNKLENKKVLYIVIKLKDILPYEKFLHSTSEITCIISYISR